MTICVLGASGRLGTMLRAAWGAQAVQWRGRDATGLPANLTCLIDLRGIVPGRGDVAQNADIAREALDAARLAGTRHVFLASTAAVYGRHPGPLRADIAAPASAYGHAKRAMEDMAAAHSQPSTCLRIGNVAGADVILSGWSRGFTLDRFADGTTPSRSYIGPDSLARVLWTLADQTDLPAILNVAAPGSVSMGDLLDAAGLEWSARKAPPEAIRDVTLDTKPLEAHVSFAPEDSTPQGIVAQWQQLKDRT